MPFLSDLFIGYIKCVKTPLEDKFRLNPSPQQTDVEQDPVPETKTYHVIMISGSRAFLNQLALC